MIVMSFISLVVVIIALVVKDYISQRNFNNQIKELNKMLMAKNLTEYSTAKQIEEPIITEEKEPDIIPLDNLNDEDWGKTVLGEGRNGQ